MVQRRARNALRARSVQSTAVLVVRYVRLDSISRLLANLSACRAVPVLTLDPDLKPSALLVAPAPSLIPRFPLRAIHATLVSISLLLE